MMKRNILLFLMAMLSMSLAAQKAERKAIGRGNDAYKEQLYGKAEEEYKKAMDVNAGSKEASYNLANAYYKQQKWNEAIQEYQHYLTLEQENPTNMSAAWANMGNTFLKKKSAEGKQQQAQAPQQGKQADNLDLSIESYKNALRLNPLDDEVRYNLAVAQKMRLDQEGDGGGQDDQKEDKEEKKEDKEDKQDQQDKDKPEEKQDQSQVSQENMEQMLKALEQEEKETQERVQQMQNQERKRQNQHNKKHNKDW